MKADTVGKLLIVAIVLLVISPIATVFAVNHSVENQIGSLRDSVNGLNNNQAFSEAIEKVSDSVYMIIKRPINASDTVSMGSIYVDSSGGYWRKGTGFAVTNDGWIVTAKHVIDNANEIYVVDYSNGKEERYVPTKVGVHENIDLGVLKIDKNTSAIKIYEGGGKLPVGYKIGFIGFPSDVLGAKITHDGVISYGTYGENGFPNYNIHAFVNGGQSGGPVFLADSGEVVGFVVARERASNLPVADYIDVSVLPQNDQSLLLLAQIYNRQSAMYDTLRNEVSDKTQMGVGLVIGLNKATVANVISLTK